MKKLIAALSLAALLPLTGGGAHAQSVPGWSIANACEGDITCPRFEQYARGQVSGIWSTLPPDVRSACITETQAVDKSYRLLYDCLSNKMQERMRGQGQRS